MNKIAPIPRIPRSGLELKLEGQPGRILHMIRAPAFFVSKDNNACQYMIDLGNQGETRQINIQEDMQLSS